MQNTSHSYTLDAYIHACVVKEYHVLYVMSYLLYIWSDPTVVIVCEVGTHYFRLNVSLWILN